VAWSALAAVLVLALLGTAWLLVRSSGLAGELARTKEDRETAIAQSRLAERRTAELQARLDRLTEELALARAAGGRVVVGVLMPGLEREGKRPSLPVPPGTEWLRLRLLLEQDAYPRYAASLQTPDGERLSEVRGLRSVAAAKGRAVEIVLPASPLEEGTYIVELQGIGRGGAAEGVAAYHLHVVRPAAAGR
jgi:hypothetical protein